MEGSRAEHRQVPTSSKIPPNLSPHRINELLGVWWVNNLQFCLIYRKPCWEVHLRREPLLARGAIHLPPLPSVTAADLYKPFVVSLATAIYYCQRSENKGIVQRVVLGPSVTNLQTT